MVVRRQFKGKAILDLSRGTLGDSGHPDGTGAFVDCFRNADSLAAVRLGLPADHRSVHQEHAFWVQIAKSVLVQLGPELEEAARISGGSWLQCYRRVLIPLLTPTFIVVGLLGFISAARDISTIVLLGSSQSRTMALLALDYAFGRQFERGAVVAFLTSLVVIVIALIAHVVGSKVGIGGHR